MPAVRNCIFAPLRHKFLGHTGKFWSLNSCLKGNLKMSISKTWLWWRQTLDLFPRNTDEFYTCQLRLLMIRPITLHIPTGLKTPIWTIPRTSLFPPFPWKKEARLHLNSDSAIIKVVTSCQTIHCSLPQFPLLGLLSLGVTMRNV